MNIKRMGWKPDLPHPGRRKYSEHFQSEMSASLMRYADGPVPVVTKVDLRNLCGPIKQQLWNNCTGHAISGALEFLEKGEYRSHKGDMQFGDGSYEPMSTMFIYWHERSVRGQQNLDNGAYISDGVETVRDKGTVPESFWPETSAPGQCPTGPCWSEGYGHREFYGYTMENRDFSQIKASLLAGFPVVFGMTVFESFMDPGPDGNIPVPDPEVEQVVGGHCLLIVGFDDSTERVIVKNSWSTAWADGGYCYLPYEMLGTDYASSFWTLRRDGTKISI